MDSDSIGVVILIVLICLKMFFSAGAEALEQLSESKLRRRAAEGNKTAQNLQKLCSGRESVLAPLVFSGMFVTILGTVVATDMLLKRFDNMATEILLNSSHQPTAFGMAVTKYAVIVLFAVVLCCVFLVFAQTVPRRLAHKNPDSAAYKMSGLLCFFVAIERPFTALLTAASKGVLTLIGAPVAVQDDQVTEEEIRELVEEGNQSGTIQKTEREMINNVFDFADRTVVEVMTHRTDLLGVSKGSGLGEVVELARTSGHSRIPVYAESVDNIQGILYVKDLLSLLEKNDPSGDFDITALMRKPMFVPESTRCNELFSQFSAKKLHMAVVVDEYGGTSGLVTMEDLVESVLGNIQDEYDNEVDNSMRITDDLFTLDGSMTIDDTERLLDIEITDDTDYETIGGLLVELLDHIPGPGEHPQLEIAGFRFTVTQADQRRITSITAQRLPAKPEERKSKKEKDA